MGEIIPAILVFLVEAIITYQYGTNLFTARHSVKNRLIMLSMLYTILFAIYFFNIAWLNMVLYFVANYVFLYFQYTGKHGISLLHSAILTSIMASSEMVILFIINRFTPNFYSNLSFSVNTILFIILSKTLFFIVTYLITYAFKSQKGNDERFEKGNLLLMVIPITTMFVISTFLDISEKYELNTFFDWRISSSALFLLGSNMLIFVINQYNHKKSQEHSETEMLLQKESSLTEYYKMLLSRNEDQSILIHDLKKHLHSIEYLNELNEQEKIKEYIDQLLSSADLRGQPKTSDRDILNAVILGYSRECIEKGIEFLTDIRSGAVDFLSDSEITALFCNLLDNSIEASVGIPKAYIELNVRKKDNTPFVLVSMVNMCRENPYLNSKKDLKTSKSDKRHHGFGLKSIARIADKYQGDIQMYYDEKTSTFHTVITLRIN